MNKVNHDTHFWRHWFIELVSTVNNQLLATLVSTIFFGSALSGRTWTWVEPVAVWWQSSWRIGGSTCRTGRVSWPWCRGIRRIWRWGLGGLWGKENMYEIVNYSIIAHRECQYLVKRAKSKLASETQVLYNGSNGTTTMIFEHDWI